MVDRLFLRLEPVQTPLLIHFFLTLGGALDPQALRAAVSDALNDHPLTRSRVTLRGWNYERRVLPLVEQGLVEVLAVHADFDPERERRQVQTRLVLSRDLPLRLLVQRDGAVTRLLLSLHHSVADAIGGMVWLDQLARRYGERLADAEPSPPPGLPASRSYRQYLRRLPWHQQVKVLLGGARALAEVWDALRGQRYATFMDYPPPSKGETEWQTLVLAPAEVKALRQWARAQGGTLNDVLLAALISAAWQVWPQAEPQPVSAHLPVNLREGPPAGVWNQVADVRIRLQPGECRDFQTAFAAVRTRTPIARERWNAIARVYERFLVSYAPPALFARVVADQMARPQNGIMSLTLSNLGDLQGIPGDFGPVRVLDGHVIGPLSSPPGMSAWATTVRDRLTLSLAYHWPAVSHERIRQLCSLLQERLAGLIA